MREAENLAAPFGDVFPVLPDLAGFANDSQNCDTKEAGASPQSEEFDPSNSPRRVLAHAPVWV
jgi:hypothetical protein